MSINSSSGTTIKCENAKTLMYRYNTNLTITSLLPGTYWLFCIYLLLFLQFRILQLK